MALNPKQKQFCQEYLIDLNGTQAAIRAGYSKKTANEQAAQLLAKVSIKKEVEKLMAKRSERTEITQDRVLKELACLGHSNIKDYIKASTDGFIVFKDIDQISEEDARAIEAIKVSVKEGKIEFKLHSKTKTLEMICRHLGMFIEKLEHSGELKVPLKLIIENHGNTNKSGKDG